MTPPPEDQPGRVRVEFDLPSYSHFNDRLNDQDKVLARIDENLSLFRKDILGNGQPGRLTKVETKVDALESHSNHLKGWIIGAGGAITLGLAIAEFFLHK